MWHEIDKNESLETSIRLIELQIEEIRKHVSDGNNAEKIVNEFCDIISISVRRIENMGFNFEQTMMKRIKTRYVGNIEEICMKYEGLL